MSIDDMVTRAVDQMHEQQRTEPAAENYFATVLVNGRYHTDLTLTRKELEDNGPNLHVLVKQMLINRGVTEDHQP